MILAKVNYNYFTLSKASCLNLKIIWLKSVSFFVFLRCRIFIRRTHGSRLSAIVRSDSICCNEMDGWKLITLFDIQILSSDIQTQGAHIICLCKGLSFYSKSTIAFDVCSIYSDISLNTYVLNKRFELEIRKTVLNT